MQAYADGGANERPIIDIACGTRPEDLLFEFVNGRFDDGGSINGTTSRACGGWGELVPIASFVVPLTDRLTHRSGIEEIEVDFYRLT